MNADLYLYEPDWVGHKRRNNRFSCAISGVETGVDVVVRGNADFVPSVCAATAIKQCGCQPIATELFFFPAGLSLGAQVIDPASPRGARVRCLGADFVISVRARSSIRSILDFLRHYPFDLFRANFGNRGRLSCSCFSSHCKRLAFNACTGSDVLFSFFNSENV